jgi:hypothetical protein
MIRITATPVSLFVAGCTPREMSELLQALSIGPDTVLQPIVHAKAIDAELRRRGHEVQTSITYGGG